LPVGAVQGACAFCSLTLFKQNVDFSLHNDDCPINPCLKEYIYLSRSVFSPIIAKGGETICLVFLGTAAAVMATAAVALC
jgi:hypothetical protein